MAERDVAQLLARERAGRGSPGGGLVQFGPSSALPHGGPSAGKLERETVVLIDAGSRNEGHPADITRPRPVRAAPRHEGQEMAALTRKVITDGGEGQFSPHRLRRAMGMDGREPPYLVDGNETRLEPG